MVYINSHLDNIVKSFISCHIVWPSTKWNHFMKPIDLNWIEEYSDGLIHLFLAGSFRQELNSEVVTFSTRLTVQPSPLNRKSDGTKTRWQPPTFCTQSSDWPKKVYFSIQVKPYNPGRLFFVNNNWKAHAHDCIIWHHCT